MQFEINTRGMVGGLCGGIVFASILGMLYPSLYPVAMGSAATAGLLWAVFDSRGLKK